MASTYWDAGQKAQPLKTIEADVGRLLRDCGNASAQADAAREQAQRELKSVLLALIDLADQFDRVLAAAEARRTGDQSGTAPALGSFHTLRRLLQRKLKDFGVVRIESLGMKAVPGLHTIVEVRPEPGREDETIIEEIQPGYRWHKESRTEVVRTAQVAVAKH
jgi:molecular chaperone GrpE